ncbi:MAG TPA: AMP-binding protein [Opitutaceae bacterium]
MSGGAPLDRDIAEFFERRGFPTLQGYGLTEASPIIAVNTLAHNRLGSVGRPLPGVEVRIDAGDHGEVEGEILTRGPHVMKGYYGDPKHTREVIDESGWLHTGDVGRMDSDGFIGVTGRLKDVIVLGGGTKVFPEEVEAALRRGNTVEEVCVVGRTSRHGITAGTEEVCAIVVPSTTVMRRHGGHMDMVERTVREELDRHVRVLAPYKRPTRLVVFPEPMPKTASHKVKRHLLLHWLENRGE